MKAIFLTLSMNFSADIYRRIVAAKIYMDENYHEPIDLDIISQQAFLSRFHFHRIFRHIYLHTPHQYLTRKRIEKAKQLLANNTPVTIVCMEIGFESIGSFSTLFKKEIGYAPTFFHNMAWLKKQEQAEQPRKAIPHCFIQGYNMENKKDPDQKARSRNSLAIADLTFTKDR